VSPVPTPAAWLIPAALVASLLVAPTMAADPPAPAIAPEMVKRVEQADAFAILGKQVRSAAGEDIGRVTDVLVGRDGAPAAVVIDVGGVLGVGSRKVAVDWSLLQFRPDNREVPILVGLIRSQIQAAPEYKPPNRPADIVTPAPPTPEPPREPPAQPPGQPPVPPPAPPPADARP
jgi:hypothetical protein